MTTTKTGIIVQIIGAVVDVEFNNNEVPKINNALKLQDGSVVFEVQQQLGDGVVRTIAMGTTDGLKRGLEVIDTGLPIQLPVVKETLGRIMNVLGEPVDEAGPIGAKEHWSIHRKPPSYEEQAGGQALLETGI